MGSETNLESIRTLEEQIEKGKGDIINLKRTRNSLLNISTRVPPEILGYIFAWIVAREQDDSLFSIAHFARLEKGTYDFLLVCRHWFEVASRTPEVWTFWGRTLGDWRKRCHRVGGAPVDLVLDGFARCSIPFDSSLRDALSDHAARDGIRQIHLAGHDSDLFGAIISSLIPSGTSPQEKRIESIDLQTHTIPEQLSHFFTRSRLPNLRYLHISGCLQTPPNPHTAEHQAQVLFWDQLALLRTTRLATLSLHIERAPLPIPASQLIPVLTSNPNLRALRLMHSGLPNSIGWPSIRVSLRQLNTMTLGGEFDRVFALLTRLELPAVLDYVVLQISHFTAQDVLHTLGPYLRDHFQRDVRFQGELAVVVSYSRFSDGFGYSTHGCIDLTSSPNGMSPSAIFSTTLIHPLPSDPASDNLTFDLAAFIPSENVTSLEVVDSIRVPEDLLVAMRNIETLRLCNPMLSSRFLQPDPKGPHANTKLLPSLRFLHLENVTASDATWEPLVTYLVHQTSKGQIISLQVSSFLSISRGVMEEIRDLVDTFVYNEHPVPRAAI